jgi:hypothetical protein
MTVVADVLGVSVRFIDDPTRAHVVYAPADPKGGAVWIPASASACDEGVSLSSELLGFGADRELREGAFDWIMPAWLILSQAEQRCGGQRDMYGRFLSSHSTLPGWVHDRPLIQQYARRLADELSVRFGSRLLSGAAPAWPEGRRFALCVTHDVDVLLRADPLRYAGMAVRGLCKGRRWMVREGLRDCLGSASAAMADNPYANWNRWLEYESDLAISSTWFFVCRPGFRWDEPQYRFESSALLGACVRAVGRAGQEIALHPWTNTSDKLARLIAQRGALERLSGETVHGSRNHLLLVNVPATWNAGAQAGLSYDASFGWVDRPGYRCGMAWPFVPYPIFSDAGSSEVASLLELPLAVMDGSLSDEMNLQADQAYEQARGIVEQAAAFGGLAVLLWHPHTMYERDFPDWFAVLQRMVEWAKGEGAWMPTMSQVVKWWQRRREIIARAAGTER